MKYCIVIIDGAADRPLPEKGNKTCLELAHTPNLDALAREGKLGLARTVPPGMEPASACACMSILGYDPRIYYKGRSAIEALSMGIDINPGEVAFRCNLVTVQDGKMADYSAGHITSEEARELIFALDEELGNENIHFSPGVSYRHLCKIKGHEDALQAVCTPPHDIPGKSIAAFLPKGPGSGILLDLMNRSEKVLRSHPVNKAREARGANPATTIWLFWASGPVPSLPPFRQVYGLSAAMTSGVDLLRGLAKMTAMDILDIPGVTDGPDNDYAAQINGALQALKTHDLTVVHVEAPDEAGHVGHIAEKVEAIEKTDQEIISRLSSLRKDSLRLLVMPDHPTPIAIRTHTDEPVPFMMWGPGFRSSGAARFTESEARKSGFFVDTGYDIIKRLITP